MSIKERQAVVSGKPEWNAATKMIGQRKVKVLKFDAGWIIKATRGDEETNLALSHEAMGALIEILATLPNDVHLATVDMFYRNAVRTTKGKS